MKFGLLKYFCGLIIWLLAGTSLSLANTYKYEFYKSIPVPGKVIVRLENKLGRIEVERGSEHELIIRADKYIKAENKDRAEELAEYLNIKAGRENNRITIKTEHKDLPRKLSLWERIFGGATAEPLGSVDFRITAPEHCQIVIRSDSGEIKITGLSENIKAKMTIGNIQLKNIRGNIDMESGGGMVTIENSAGDLNLNVPGSDVILDDVTGAIDIYSSSGTKRVHNITGRISITQTNGDISLKNINGDIRLKANSGRIDVDQKTGSINIVGNSNSVDIKTEFRSGDDYIIETASGPISFMIPAGSSGKVRLESARGKINISLPIVNELSNKNKIQGSFGHGGTTISLVTTSGNIGLGQF